MDTVNVAVFNNGTYLNTIVFANETDEQIQSFIESIGATSFQRLADDEYISGDAILKYPKPFPSWVWDSETRSYMSPKTQPEGNFYWHEQDLEWKEQPAPPSDNHRWDFENYNWYLL